ncbi:hypothetical protein ACWEK5_44690 [Rhodococcus koreensis]
MKAMKVRHPLWNHEYEQQADGSVQIVDLDSGSVGAYDRYGHRLGGEVTLYDPQLLDWVGGKPLRRETVADDS